MTECPRFILEHLRAAPGGRLSFARMMELALYDPQEGYYGAGPPRIGRGGDFFTSVSTGPLFGRLLAMLARQRWERCGSPPDFMLVEQGAHDGQLAEDILAALDIPGASYGIVEPNPRYREVQRQRLGERVRWLDGLSQVPQASFLLSNELPDAFPVHVLRWMGGQWLELQVNAALEWVPCPVVEAELAAEVARLPQDVEEGHTVEVSLEALRWLRMIIQASGGEFCGCCCRRWPAWCFWRPRTMSARTWR